MSTDNTSLLTELGKQSAQPSAPDQARLEPIPWNNQDAAYPGACIRYTCPEFTSLCPVTGQPDFAHITIDYIPSNILVESKSLKLFMASFRNHGAFHETTTLLIAQRFIACCWPKWLRIVALWYPRGGIPIDVFWQTGSPPAEVYIPEVNLMLCRGR